MRKRATHKVNIMLRGEEMELYRLVIGKKSAHDVVHELGKVGMVQFVNRNKEVSSFDPMKGDKILKKLNDVQKMKVKVDAIRSEAENYGLELSDTFDKDKSMDEAIVELDLASEKIALLRAERESTARYVERLKEDLFVLREDSLFFKDVNISENGVQGEKESDLHDFPGSRPVDSVNVSDEDEVLSHFSGVIPNEKEGMFCKFVYNTLRRNFIIHSNRMDDGDKTCFIVMTHGVESSRELKKAFIALGGRIFEPGKDREKEQISINSLISQVSLIEEKNKEAMVNMVLSTDVNTWAYVALREYRIYNTMRKMRQEGDDLVCEAWVPKRCGVAFNEAVREINDGIGTIYRESIEFDSEPEDSDDAAPTCVFANKYLEIFRNISNEYAIPRYRDVSPGIFYIFALPFIFGSMYPDVAHGFILLLIGLFMIYNMKAMKFLSKKIDFLPMIISARYLFIGVGIFSIYFGFLMNEFMGFPIPLFRSRFDGASVYPFGLDYGWAKRSGGDEFISNMKMKCSIIFGYFHMLFGNLISVFNTFTAGDYLDLLTVSIPATIACISFTGYLVFLIFLKWTVAGYSGYSIISVCVEMYTEPFGEPKMYSYQGIVQKVLIILIASTFVFRMIVRSTFLIMNARKKNKKGSSSEIIINQGVGVVEYGIGLLSDTTSYLRIWALSLAHSSLTAILNNFFLIIWKKNIALGLIFFTSIYIPATFLVLIVVEGMSTMLHAVRLNWIEFGGKFIRQGGKPFRPLKFDFTPDSDMDDDDG